MPAAVAPCGTWSMAMATLSSPLRRSVRGSGMIVFLSRRNGRVSDDL
jgi:hypothetical protein